MSIGLSRSIILIFGIPNPMSLNSRIDALTLRLKGRSLDKDRSLRLRYLRHQPDLIFDWLSRDRDDWQVELINRLGEAVNSGRGGLRTIVAASRQCGKSEFSSLWIAWSVLVHGHQIAVSSPSFRQSLELVSKARAHISNLGLVPIVRDSMTDFQIGSGGRLVILPGDGTGRTSRGFRLDQVIFDEAAFFESDALIPAIGPSLALANGSILMVSSPGGSRGLFFDAWRSDNFHKVKVRADQCSRIPREFLENQRQMLSPAQYSREFEAEFVSDSGTWIRQDWIDQALYDPDDEDLPVPCPGSYYDEEDNYR